VSQLDVVVKMDLVTWQIVLNHLLDDKEYAMQDSEATCIVVNTEQKACLRAELKE